MSTVLLVHPEPLPARQIAEALRAEGFTVVTVPDGERAIDRFIQEPFDLILIEMVLPGRDGGNTAASIRWAPQGNDAKLALIATRGTGTEELAAAEKETRAAATYVGPPDPARICELAHQALEAAAPEPEMGAALVDIATSRGKALAPGTTSTAAARENRAYDEETYEDSGLTTMFQPGDDPGAEKEGQVVERWAGVAGSEVTTQRGDLASTPFPKVLHQLGRAKVRGALVITAREDGRATTTGETPKKVVFFDDGTPVYVQSNLVEECLGWVLARAGRITEEELDQSVKRMRAGEGRQGAVLLGMRVIDARGLRDALADQLRVKLFDLFTWRQGRFEFSPEIPPPAETVTLDMPLADMILRGVIHRVSPTHLLDLLSPDIERYVVPYPSRLRAFSELELEPDARAVLSSLDGTQRIRDLLTAGTRPGATAQLLYALHCTEAVSLTPTPRQVTPGAFAAPEIYVRPTDLAALREELARIGRLLREERYEEALGIDGLANADIAERVERLRARYRPVTEAGVAPRDMRTLAHEIIARLPQAEEALATPLVKISKRARGPNEPRPLPLYDAQDLAERTTNEGALTSEPTRALASQEISAIARALADPDEPTSNDGSDDALGPDPLAPPSVFDESTHPGEPRASLLDAARGSIPMSEPTRVAPPLPAPSRSAADALRDLDERVQRLGQAERFFRRGERALVRERFDDAKRAFQQASERCPDEGDFLAHLAYARFLAGATDDPDERALALGELAVARELAPKLDRVYVLAARVHEALGELDDARDMYVHALAANPECLEALTSLDALSEREPEDV